jgi:hypothetical protein
LQRSRRRPHCTEESAASSTRREGSPVPSGAAVKVTVVVAIVEVERTAVEKGLVEPIAVEGQETVQAPAEGASAKAVLHPPQGTRSAAEESKVKAELQVRVESAPQKPGCQVETATPPLNLTGDATMDHLSSSSGSVERSFSSEGLTETVESRLTPEGDGVVVNEVLSARTSGL